MVKYKEQGGLKYPNRGFIYRIRDLDIIRGDLFIETRGLIIIKEGIYRIGGWGKLSQPRG